MSFTMREGNRPFLLLALWGLVSLFAAAAGPFGTFEGMGFLGRLAYWAVIVAVSILLTLGQKRLFRGRAEGWRLVSQLPYAGILALLAHGMNLLLFPHWGGWQDLGFLFVVTLTVVLLIEISVFLVRAFLLKPREGAAEVSQDTVAEISTETRFLRRLPLDKRAPLIRLEAQDHYLLVVTERGCDSLLLRLSDAEAELGEVGLRVHRSHWIAFGKIQQHRRDKGRDFLQMTDDCLVPVSRSYKASVQAAGLL